MRWIERWRRCKKWNAIAQRIRKVRPRRAGLDCRFAAAHLSHYWALLLERAVAGFGDSAQAALRAFDVQYSRSLRPPADRD